MSKFNGKKTNNARIDAKIVLRESILAELNHTSSVLEVFCGSGEMYSSVWSRAKKYKGIDKKKSFDERDAICGDAYKALKLINIKEYDIFDIDSYGSPYTILSEIIDNIGYQAKIGFVITDGTQMDLRMGRVCDGIRRLSGIESSVLKKAHLIHDKLILMIVNNICRKMGGVLQSFKIAKGVTGSGMRYYSFIVNRDSVSRVIC